MLETNYYKILGVDKKADNSEIKKAYRKLAMKYHPDHTKGDKLAEDKFKEISEAYAVLSDKEKRKQYDEFGSAGFRQRYSQEDIFGGSDLGDILKEFGFGGSNFFRGNPGGRKFSFNSGCPFGAGQRQQWAKIKGSDLIYELPLTLQELTTGTSKTISFQHKGHLEKITVQIPKGLIAGKKLRLQGKGEQGQSGGPPGDLYIQSKVIDDPVYRVKGYDLYINRDIKLSDAILGTSISVPTLDSKKLSLKIPSGSKHKTKLRLPGHGLPHTNGKEKGDLFVTINVDMPKHLSTEQKKIIKNLARAGL